MAKKKIWNEPIDKTVDWGGDESTGGLPVSGEQVQKFIKEKLTLDKFGYSRIVEDKEQYFANEFTASLYDEDPIANKAYLLHEVQLPSGGGSGMLYYIRTVNNLETRNFAVSHNKVCIIDFTFVSQFRESAEEPYENTGERGYVQVYARAKGKEYKLVSEFYCDSNISVKIDVKDYLTSGENDIMIRVSGEESLQAAPALTYGITLTALSLNADNFTWWRTFKEDFSIPFQIGGNVDKNLIVTISDGAGYTKDYQTALGKTVYLDTAYNFSMPHPQKSGVFKIRARVENNDATIVTDTVEYNVICVLAGEDTKLIAINNFNNNVTNWTDNKVLEYTCYDSDNATTSLLFEVYKDDELVYSEDNAEVLTDTRNSLSIPLEIDTIDNSNFELSLFVKDTLNTYHELTLSVDNSLGYSAMSGASVYFNPKTRNNSQANKEQFINEVNGQSINAQWTNIGWGLDGWTQDDNGNKTLRLFAGTSITLDYAPFAVEPARSGKTIEIDLAVRNVSDYTNLVLDMFSNNVGVRVYPDSVSVFSQSLKNADFQSVNFKDDERVKLTFVLVPNAYGNNGFNLCIVFINGVKNREFTYESNDYFQQNGNLTIGCLTADVDIYGFRVYDFALTTGGVLRNLLNWETSSQKRQEISTKNDVLDANGNYVDYAKVSTQYNTFVFTGDIPSLNNPNRFKGDLIVSWADNPEWNSIVHNVECDGQGTSAKKYWKWNLRWKLKSDTKVTYADGTETTGKWKFVPNQPALNKATAKLNWASSMQSHKMGSVNSIDDLAKELGIVNDARARIAVYQYPFVGFSMTVNEDGEEIYTFLGLFTLGPDKGDTNTFGYDEGKYPNLLSLEGADNAPLPALFRVPWNKQSGRFTYNEDEESFQYNGVNSWDFNAGNLDKIDKWIDAYNFVYECSPRLSPYEGTLDQLNSEVNTYKNQPCEFWLPNGDVVYYEASLDKFIYADTGNGTINLVSQLVDKDYGLASSDLEGKTSSQKNDLFIAARIEKFRLEMQTYWDLDDAIFQRNWVEFNAATDNRAKNTYPYTFGGTWRWRADDTDTIWPINNQGQSSKGYEVEVGDKYDNGQPVWNGETSNFWNLLEFAFPTEIENGMRDFMSAMEELGGKSTGTSLEKIYAFYQKYYFDMAQEYFSQTLYNEAAKNLYESAKVAYIKGTYTNDTDPITQSLGDHYSAEKRWLVKRIMYMMSKYSYGEFSSSGTDNITVRASGNIIKYELTPAIWMYPNIVNGTSIVRGERTEPGEKTIVEVDLGGSADQQNTIQGASYIQDIGEWYDKSVQGSMIVKGRMLTNLSLGHKSNPITISITSLTLSDVPALKKLTLSRIATLGGTLNLSECMRLEECHMDGTSIIQTIFPQGGNLKKVIFGSENKYIRFQNLSQLTESEIDISSCKTKITDFLIGSCPNLKALTMLYNVYNSQSSQAEKTLKRIRCTGVNETAADGVIDMLYFFTLGGYNGLDSEGVGTTGLPIIEGNLHVVNAVKSTVERLRTLYPQLTITYDEEIVPSGYTIEITSKTTFRENEDIQLTAETTNPLYPDVEWVVNSYVDLTSSEISVDKSTGRVTFNKPGNHSGSYRTNIRAVSKSNPAIFQVFTLTITCVAATSIELICSADKLVYGKTYTLETKVLPEDCTKETLCTYSFDREGIIELSSDGTISVLNDTTELVKLSATLAVEETIKSSITLIVNDGPIATAETNPELVRVAFEQSWSTNPEVFTLSEAMAVTSFSTDYFSNNTRITSLEELKFFTGVTSWPSRFCRGCTSLTNVALPPNLTGNVYDLFAGCPNLTGEILLTGTAIYWVNAPFEVIRCEEGVMGVTLNNSATKKVYLSSTIVGFSNGSAKLNEFHIPSMKRLLRINYSTPTPWSNSETKVYVAGQVLDINARTFRVPNLEGPMGDNCLSGWAFEEVTFEEGTTRVNGFYNCKNLKTIDLRINSWKPDRVPWGDKDSWFASGAFRGCENMEIMYLPNVDLALFSANETNVGRVFTFSNKLTFAGDYEGIIDGALYTKDKKSLVAYRRGDVTEVVLPESVTSIRDYAFYKSNVKKVTANGVTIIRGNAFESSSIEEFVSSYTGDFLIGGGAYYYNDKGNDAFRGCQNLRKVSLPNANITVKSGNHFYNCQNLKEFPFDRLMNVEYPYPSYVFYGCTFGDIEVALSSISSNFFSGMTAESITFTQNINKCEKGAFYNAKIKKIVFRGSVETMGDAMFEECTNLIEVTLPQTVTTFSSAASMFKNCQALTRIELPAWFDKVSSYTFSGCKNLNTIICRSSTTTGAESSTFGTNSSTYTGRNTYNTGENTLYVPAGATGYDTGQWLDPLQNAEKCGFTLSATL